jgi:hypothetical protein
MVGMRISRKHKFVYVSQPKAWTNTIYYVLHKYYGPLVSRAYHGLHIPPEFDSYFKWTVVRNPYARVYSSWWAAIGCGGHRPKSTPQRPLYYNPNLPRDTDFKEFVRRLTSPPGLKGAHCCTLQFRLDANKYDRIVMVENFGPEFRKLPFYKRNCPPRVPCLNDSRKKAPGKHFVLKSPKEEYDQETADLVYRWERSIFDDYGYDRDSWMEL